MIGVSFYGFNEMTEVRKLICDGCDREITNAAVSWLRLEARPSVPHYVDPNHQVVGTGKDFCSFPCLLNWLEQPDDPAAAQAAKEEAA
jgi:hypothetical protein